MYMTEPEVKGLRDYLLAGGFLMIDDFWGSAEWANFEAEVKRVLPEYPIIEIPLDHPVFTPSTTLTRSCRCRTSVAPRAVRPGNATGSLRTSGASSTNRAGSWS